MMKRFLILLVTIILLPSLSWGATYYVDSVGGSDTGCTGLAGTAYDGSGTGEACAWKTLAKVNSSVSGSGDDVYLKEGTTSTVPSGTSYGFHIDWTGTSGDRVIIGSYYLDESNNPVVGYQTSRPKISGVGRTLPNTTGDSRYAVSVTGDYVTIQDLEVLESARVGIRVNQDADNIIIQRCYVHHNYSAGISLYFSDNSQVLNNLVYYNTYWDFAEGGDWASSIGLRGCNGAIVTRNKVWNGWGEGISLFDNTDGFTVGENIVYDMWGPHIYVETGPRNGTIYRNLVYRSTSTPLRSGAPHWSIMITVESDQPYYSSNATAGNFKNIDVWGNLVIGGKTQIGVVAASASYPYTNVKVYNNTLLEPYSSSTLSKGVWFGNVTSCVFRNNIVWQTSGNAAVQADFPSSGVTRSNNAWSKAASGLDDDAEGTGDVYSFAGVTKTTGLAYTELSPGSITGAEFALPAGSAAIGEGVNLCPSGCATGYEYNTLLDPTLIDLTVPTWATTTQGENWDIGALPETTLPEGGGGGGETEIPSGVQVAWKLSADLNSFIGTANLSATGTVSQAADHMGTANSARSVASEANSNYLSVADAAVLNPSGSMAISYWYKKTGAVTNDSLNWIIGKGSTNRPWGFRYYTYGANDILQFGVKNTTGTPSNYAAYTFTGAMPTDTWIHIVAMFNAETRVASVYVDGVKGTDYTYAYSTLYDDNEALYIFSAGGALKSIPGVIDDIVLYHRVLTTQEITALRNLGSDFSTEATDPVPNLLVNSFGSGGYAVPLRECAADEILAETCTEGQMIAIIPLAWTLSGAAAAECGVWNGEGEEDWGDPVTCGDNAYDLVLTAAGLYDNIKLRAKASGGDYVYSVLPNPIYVMASDDGEWIVAATGGDDIAAACGAGLGPSSGATIQVSDANVDLSACTAMTSVRFAGTTEGTRTFKPGGQIVQQWPTFGGRVIFTGPVAEGSTVLKWGVD